MNKMLVTNDRPPSSAHRPPHECAALVVTCARGEHLPLPRFGGVAGAAEVGLGRIVVLYCRSSALYQIR